MYCVWKTTSSKLVRNSRAHHNLRNIYLCAFLFISSLDWPDFFLFQVLPLQKQSVSLPTAPPAGSPESRNERNRGGEDLQLMGIYIQNHEMLNISHMIRHTYLEYEVLLWLEVEFSDWLAYVLLKLMVSLSWDVQKRKQITYQTQKYWHVTRHNLWQVKVSQSTHQHLKNTHIPHYRTITTEYILNIKQRNV